MTKRMNIALNEMDTMFYCFECMGYPPVGKIHFELKGSAVDSDVLQRACSLMLERFPSFAGLLQENVTWFRWDISWYCDTAAAAEHAVAVFDYSGKNPEEARKMLESHTHEPLQEYSSHEQRPFRMVLCRMPGGVEHLLFYMNHACADGYGFLWFIQEFFGLYNYLLNTDTPYQWSASAPSTSPSSLLPKSLSRKVLTFAGALGVLINRRLRNIGVKNANLIQGKSSFKGSVRTKHRILEADAVAQYVKAARYHDAGMSEMLVAAQVIALERYRAECGEKCDGISVQIHHNIRTSPQQLRETGNFFSTMIIETRAHERASPDRIIKNITHKRRCVKSERMAERINSLLWLFRFGVTKKLLPFWGPAVFNNPEVGDSLTVSNVSRIWMDKQGNHLVTNLGKAEVQACYMYGTPIPSTGTFMIIYTVHERLYLSFHYFEWAMSDAQADRYLDMTVNALDEYCQSNAANKNQRR
ncbi:MAG: hypothetical protein GY868_16390 [Deltaproteobacteria bacterium]|nr:hypothetical protein [Deltaproteobacteria bacterium]